MDFALSANQESIRDAVGKICSRFDDAYWLKKDKEGGYPADFHRALADAGWLGICIPEEYGGSGLGITDAAIMMRTISESGAGMSGASAVHMNVFGLNPVVVFGTPEQCRRMLPPIVSGAEKSCFAVTEPNTGLKTTQLKTRAGRSLCQDPHRLQPPDRQESGYPASACKKLDGAGSGVADDAVGGVAIRSGHALRPCGQRREISRG